MPPSNAKVLPLSEMMQPGQPDATRPAADARTSNPARRSVVRRLRGAARVRTEVAVTLRVDGEAHPVTMVNVSERGLGLVGVPLAVPEGRKLAIELPDGTVLSGCAQWSRADRLGVAIAGASYLAGMGWKRDPTEAPVADPVNSAALGSTSVGTRILSWFRRAATSARPSSAVPGSARQLERAWRKNGIAVLLPPADGQRD